MKNILFIFIAFCFPLTANQPSGSSRIAIHEIGHALMAHKHGLEIHSISIVPNRFYSGYVDFGKSPDVRKNIQVYLGGIAAEELFISETHGSKGGSDLRMVLDLIEQNRDKFHTSTEDVYREQLAITKRMLQKDSDLIPKLTKILLKSKKLTGREFSSVIKALDNRAGSNDADDLKRFV